MRIIECKYDLGQILYLKTDKDQCERIVTQICFNGYGLQYNLVCGDRGSWHYEFEITEEKNVIAATTG